MSNNEHVPPVAMVNKNEASLLCARSFHDAASNFNVLLLLYENLPPCCSRKTVTSKISPFQVDPLLVPEEGPRPHREDGDNRDGHQAHAAPADALKLQVHREVRAAHRRRRKGRQRRRGRGRNHAQEGALLGGSWYLRWKRRRQHHRQEHRELSRRVPRVPERDHALPGGEGGHVLRGPALPAAHGPPPEALRKAQQG